MLILASNHNIMDGSKKESTTRKRWFVVSLHSKIRISLFLKKKLLLGNSYFDVTNLPFGGFYTVDRLILRTGHALFFSYDNYRFLIHDNFLIVNSCNALFFSCHFFKHFILFHKKEAYENQHDLRELNGMLLVRMLLSIVVCQTILFFF
ncbi:hypothetical protein BDC45DRAFT_58004 [Circinella umbellata]|nr:hypothetical protein BDC45DRAFT_58004 [Circinella umbellata]